MDINRLRFFVDAAHTLNFSRTAARMHTSQSTVSKYIQDLEKTLQVTLFERKPGSLCLSREGEALLPWARKLINECARFEDLAQALRDNDVAGVLRIACTTAAGKYVLPRLLMRFRAQFPRVACKVLTCNPPNVTGLLRAGEADLAAVSFEMTAPNLEFQDFFEDHIVAIVPVASPWLDRDEISVDEIVSQPLILREATSGTRKTVLAALAAHDITLEDLNVVLELGNAESIVAAVAAGLGFSFVSKSSAYFALQAGFVREITIRELQLRRRILMVRERGNRVSRPAELFWGFVNDPDNQDVYQNTLLQ